MLYLLYIHAVSFCNIGYRFSCNIIRCICLLIHTYIHTYLNLYKQVDAPLTYMYWFTYVTHRSTIICMLYIYNIVYVLSPVCNIIIYIYVWMYIDIFYAYNLFIYILTLPYLSIYLRIYLSIYLSILSI